MIEEHIMNVDLDRLNGLLQGELLYDDLLKTLYATDASVYREFPLAVAFPKCDTDIAELIGFANLNNVSLIPRAAGTSLAGQCVGEGIIVDSSKYYNQVLEINAEEKWVRVQPGVVRDELNYLLKDFGLFFSPITSTANRAMIGGMVGNNSCGTNSIVYGSTRDKVISISGVLSDGSIVSFGDVNEEERICIIEEESLQGEIFKFFDEELSNPSLRNEIVKQSPSKGVHRRNTGYAIDALIDQQPYTIDGGVNNMAKLLCGSEGTLMFTTEVKLSLDQLPPKYNVVLAAHFDSLRDSLMATQVAMTYKPYACELMDKTIMDCTKENKEISQYRFFVEGDPVALLLIECRADSHEEVHVIVQEIIEDLQSHQLGYAYPIVPMEKTAMVWKLRSAGLGVLANLSNDKKAVACIEDTAVDIKVLPEYIEEFAEIMKSFDQEAVYYAHAGAGEIHLRPLLNLKKSEDVSQFYEISKKTAELVKKYNGSLSGEHGDGRVRAPFIPMMVGPEVYALYQRIKDVWDPNGIFNRGKILNAPPMNESLRYEPDRTEPIIETLFDFGSQGGILRAAEQCNGSGDCRKLPMAGGVMCPSYMATREEKDSTRGRANTLREFLTHSQETNNFDHIEIKEVMDLCVSCKGCSTECPSNVDMTRLKAEFEYQYQKSNGVPLRSRLFAYINELNTMASFAPWLFNFTVQNSFFSSAIKLLFKVAPERSIPTIAKQSLRRWFKAYSGNEIANPIKEVYLFIDEFTNYNDVEIGQKAIQLLNRLRYRVHIVEHDESGRAAFSKGLLDKAKKHANRNVKVFSTLISTDRPLVGIEPSCILSFKDEYPLIVDKALVQDSLHIKEHTFIIDDFIAEEISKGNISSTSFHADRKQIMFHGHCHQKSLSDQSNSIKLMSLPVNYDIELIPSGCCGMAGSFGYEKEHFELSQKIGELVLFPAIRRARTDTIVCATGTSCRHQIKDELGKTSFHPIEILYDALV